ncbi:MAG: hypothetical protein KatS3mg087_0431 [Patescibacteria group bacterium]|nr:MAG: hypothetical protein KatS3mg087_0431 [Patescibacteria group bacterium]
MKESQFQNYVVRVAKDNGWLVQHTRRALSQSGRYLTPVQGHVGYPDLTLVYLHEPYRVVFAELKRDAGFLKREQRVWLYALNRVPGNISVCVWKPRDLDAIVAFLENPEGDPPGLINFEMPDELKNLAAKPLEF